MAPETLHPPGLVASEPSGRAAFLSMVDDCARQKAGTSLLCVVVDLGDLHRADRVARTLGPGYTADLLGAAVARIQAAIGAEIPVFQVDSGCMGLLLADDGGTFWQALVENLVGELRLPLDCNGLPGAVEPSVGLARWRAGDGRAEDMLLAAMAAAQDARDSDVAWRLQEAGANRPSHRLRGLVAGLPVALAASDQLSLAYQPRIDLHSGVCLSAEALLRWHHPALGNVPPGEFIPIAERTGMVRAVTAWVVERALTDLADWTRAGFSHGISINISASNLAEANFAGWLGEAIGRHRLEPARIELEFTEGALVRSSKRVRDTVADLAALGVAIAIDDFGTGYSNLQYLRDLPASVVKIDQRFISSMTANARDPVIVHSMIELAHRLGYRVVAEGIEDSQALAMLAGWTCDEGQGYHISRPVPLPAMQAWVQAMQAWSLTHGRASEPP